MTLQKENTSWLDEVRIGSMDCQHLAQLIISIATLTAPYVCPYRKAMIPDNTLRDLITRITTQGRVETIVVRLERNQPAQYVDAAKAEPGSGLIGDRRSQTKRTNLASRKRELTLIQAEHLPLIARWCRLEHVEAARLRRNLVISGVNLLAMKSPFADVRLEWQIGAEVSIEVTGPCDPCSKMEVELGQGGYNAMRGHGGVTAMIVAGGIIRVGDAVTLKAVHQV
jgi:MOSC domain-containing protein YiiM